MTKRRVRNNKVEVEMEQRGSFIPDHTKQRPTLPVLKAANDKQRQAISDLDQGKSIVFLIGTAGTGKSLISVNRAAKQINQKLIEKVVLVRPAVAVGKTIGLLPGTVEEKLAPYFAQTIAHFKTFLGDGLTKYLLEKKQIEMFPVEYMRGMSFENCIVIFEETQNFTFEEFEMVLTRLGKNCQFIFTGDQKQTDLKVENGLTKTINLLDKMIKTQPDYLTDEDLDVLEDNIAVINFLPEDCVRSGVTRAFVKMYYNN